MLTLEVRSRARMDLAVLVDMEVITRPTKLLLRFKVPQNHFWARIDAEEVVGESVIVPSDEWLVLASGLRSQSSGGKKSSSTDL